MPTTPISYSTSCRSNTLLPFRWDASLLFSANLHPSLLLWVLLGNVPFIFFYLMSLGIYYVFFKRVCIPYCLGPPPIRDHFEYVFPMWDSWWL